MYFNSIQFNEKLRGTTTTTTTTNYMIPIHPKLLAERSEQKKHLETPFFRVTTHTSHSVVLKFLPVAAWGIFNNKEHRKSVWSLAILVDLFETLWNSTKLIVLVPKRKRTRTTTTTTTTAITVTHTHTRKAAAPVPWLFHERTGIGFRSSTFYW